MADSHSAVCCNARRGGRASGTPRWRAVFVRLWPHGEIAPETRLVLVQAEARLFPLALRTAAQRRMAAIPVAYAPGGCGRRVLEKKPAVIGSNGVPAGRVLRCETNSRLFRLTPIKINKTAARAAGALLDGGRPLHEQRRHSRVALLPRLYFRRQGAVDFLGGGAAARGRRRAAAALSVARARVRRRCAGRVAATGGRRRARGRQRPVERRRAERTARRPRRRARARSDRCRSSAAEARAASTRRAAPRRPRAAAAAMAPPRPPSTALPPCPCCRGGASSRPPRGRTTPRRRGRRRRRRRRPRRPRRARWRRPQRRDRAAPPRRPSPRRRPSRSPRAASAAPLPSRLASSARSFFSFSRTFLTRLRTPLAASALRPTSSTAPFASNSPDRTSRTARSFRGLDYGGMRQNLRVRGKSAFKSGAGLSRDYQIAMFGNSPRVETFTVRRTASGEVAQRTSAHQILAATEVV